MRRKLCYSTNKYFFEFTKAPYDEVNLQKRRMFGIISNTAKMKDFPSGETSLILSCPPAACQVEALR